MGLSVTSEAFPESGFIPQRYTCDGVDESPPVEWEGVPDGAESLVVILEDPDAPQGLFTHWIVYDIPREVRRLEPDERAAGKMATNDFHVREYRGPCPAPAEEGEAEHRYVLRVYALDTPSLIIHQSATRHEVEMAMKDHVLDDAQTSGVYRRAPAPEHPHKKA